MGNQNTHLQTHAYFDAGQRWDRLFENGIGIANADTVSMSNNVPKIRDRKRTVEGLSGKENGL